MTNQEIIQNHPAPWRHMTNVGMPGNTIMVDAKNQQVQLFTIIEFVQNVTSQMAVETATPT